jgi:hypothetical protein
MLIRCFQYKLADGTVADFFATEEAILALNATKLSHMYAELDIAELDKFGKIAVAELLSKKIKSNS